MMLTMGNRKCLRDEHRYEFSITLATHPAQQGNRDPRRVWCYDCGLRNSSVEDNMWRNERTYYFAEEADFLMFRLRWENDAAAASNNNTF